MARQPRQPRQFTAQNAVRSATPLFIGLFGPSSSGKTYSALELAMGIQSVVGGEVVGIDTENRRMLHYAEKFAFKHIDFQPPFGSLDYRDVIHAAEKMGAKTVIIDSMSHEHEGPGGMIELHDQVATRMATWDGTFDPKKYEKVKMLAWNEPKQNRRALLNTLVRTDLNVVCCWRAKHTSKPQTVPILDAQGNPTRRTKQEVIDMGYTPIGGEEFIFEMTLAAFLPPGAKGVPVWNPEKPGERAMVKLTEDHQWLAKMAEQGKPLTRQIGAGLARWAQGSTGATKAEPSRAGPGLQGDEPIPDAHARGDYLQNDAPPVTQSESFDDEQPAPPPPDDRGGYEGV